MACISDGVKTFSNSFLFYLLPSIVISESMYYLSSGKLVELAPAQIVDCDSNMGGCGGGWPWSGRTALAPICRCCVALHFELIDVLTLAFSLSPLLFLCAAFNLKTAYET